MTVGFELTKLKPGAAMSGSGQPKGSVFLDRSLWSLLASNTVTIVLAITQHWSLVALMWIYWFQSIVIGFFSFLRIWRLTEFSTDGVTINDRPVEPTQETKHYIARSFLQFYGIFHLVFLIVLLVISLTGILNNGDATALNASDLKYIVPTALLFLGNHLFSYFYNRPRDTGRQNIGALMFYPSARIIPMHLTITVGLFLGGGLLLFLLLKTLADAIMHIWEHRVLRKGTAPQL